MFFLVTSLLQAPRDDPDPSVRHSNMYLTGNSSISKETTKTVTHQISYRVTANIKTFSNLQAGLVISSLLVCK